MILMETDTSRVLLAQASYDEIATAAWNIVTEKAMRRKPMNVSLLEIELAVGSQGKNVYEVDVDAVMQQRFQEVLYRNGAWEVKRK